MNLKVTNLHGVAQIASIEQGDLYIFPVISCAACGQIKSIETKRVGRTPTDYSTSALAERAEGCQSALDNRSCLRPFRFDRILSLGAQ